MWQEGLLLGDHRSLEVLVERGVRLGAIGSGEPELAVFFCLSRNSSERDLGVELTRAASAFETRALGKRLEFVQDAGANFSLHFIFLYILGFYSL